MKRLSQALGLLGFLLLVAAIASFVVVGPRGGALRWDWIVLLLVGALTSFVAACRVGRR